MTKTKYLVIFLALLVLGMSVAVAADVDDSTSTTKVTKDTTKIVKNTAVTKKATKTTDKKTTKAKENTKTKNINTTEKIITKKNTQKSVKADPHVYNVNNDTFDDIFTNGILKSTVNASDEINFTGSVSRSNSSYVINQAVNVNGNGFTLDLNTLYGYDDDSNPTYIEFNNGASNSNITNLKFHNTQVFTTSASNIVFDHINSTVNQDVGKGTGYFAMRTGVSNITVKNSYFYGEDNSGCSAVVITFGENCTIDNNTIIGQGTVGNLVYLNQFGQTGNGISQNKNNTISNNTIIGPDESSSICQAITIGGPHNHIINNTINYSGKGIIGNWAGTYNQTTNTTNDYYNDTYIGNGYINNTINNGASFSGAQCSLVAGNNFTGTVSIAKNSTVIDNRFYNTATINQNSNVTSNQFNRTATIKKYANVKNNQFNDTVTINEYSNVTNNIFKSTITIYNNVNFKNNIADNSTLYVNGSNCDLCNDTVNTIVLKSGITNTSICYDMIGINIEKNGCVINWYFHPSSLDLSKKSSRSVKNDGAEPNVIDITEENFNTYFSQDNNTQMNTMMMALPGDTIFNLYYVPSDQKKLKFLTLSQQKYHITVVGKNNLTLHNVYLLFQGSDATIKDINLIYDDEISLLNNGIDFSFAPVFSDIPLVMDNITVNYDGEYLDDGIHPVIRSSSTNSKAIVQNSVINVNVPAVPGGYAPIRGPGVSLINNNITITEKYAVAGDSPSLLAINEITQSGYPILIENNNITVIGKSDLVGIIFDESVTDSNITNNNITVTSTESTATGIKLNGNDNIVTGNAIIANTVTGDDAVVATGDNNVVQGNGPMGTELTVINPSVVNVNEVSPMTVILKDAKGNLLANQDINVTVGDDSEIIKTDASGIAVYKFLPTTSGSADIVFNSISDGMFLSSNKTVTVTVNEDKDAIIEELNKTVQEQKETIASNEEDIEDLNNIIKNQDDEIESLTNTTQALNNTVAQLEQDIKDVQEQLTNNNNTNTNGTSSGNGTSNNTSTPTKTSVTLKLNPTTIYTGSKTKITATLKDANKKAIASQKISIKVGTKTYTVKTNKKGVATKTVKVTKTGKNKVTATFKATKKYAKATKSATLTVKAKEKTKITVTKLSYKNKKITIKATIKAGKKALKQNTKLTIKVDGKTLTSKKISKKGKISLTLKKALKKGSHKVQIISKATSMYKQAKVSKTLKV